jgi:hypothetical protein
MGTSQKGGKMRPGGLALMQKYRTHFLLNLLDHDDRPPVNPLND